MAVNKNTKTYVLIGIIIALLLLVAYFIFFRNKKEAIVTVTDNDPAVTNTGIGLITDIQATPIRSAINQQVQPAIINEAISVDNALVNVPKKATSYAVLDATNLQTTTATPRFTALNPVTVALKSK